MNLLIRFLLGLHYSVGVLQGCHMEAATDFSCSQCVGHQSAVDYNTHHMCSLAQTDLTLTLQPQACVYNALHRYSNAFITTNNQLHVPVNNCHIALMHSP